jgi:undecaprenyl-diphosphatase
MSIDTGLIHALNSLAGKSPLVDTVLARLLDLPSVKMLPLVALVWALWFDLDNSKASRQCVVQAFAGAFIALVVSRLIQDIGPFRARPLHDPALGLVLPFGITEDTVQRSSSFPSDHAALAFALATGIIAASRPLGLVAFASALLSTCLARVYAGFHYPTDVAAGAALGVFSTWLAMRFLPMWRLQAFIHRFSAERPVLFYFIAFCFAYQVVSLFWDLRIGAEALRGAIGATH